LQRFKGTTASFFFFTAYFEFTGLVACTIIIANYINVLQHADAPMENSNPPLSHPSPILSRSNTPLTSSSLSDGVSLEALFDLCKDTMGLVRALDTRLGRVEEDNKKLTSVVKELNDYVKKSYKESFTVKGSQYEVSNSWSSL
jgi:hypothetical protein